MRLPALLVLFPTVALAQPTAPCELAAYRELEAVQQRVRALAKTGSPSRADITNLIADLPTSYVWAQGGGPLVAEQLAQVDKDIDAVLTSGSAWTYRCAAYPNWHVPPKPIKNKKQRLAIAQRTKAAHVRHAECERLTGKVLGMPSSKRWGFRGALDRCYVDLHAARAKCEADYKDISHTDAFAVFREQIAVSNVYELRRTRPPTAEDVAVLRARIEPMLDALPPPLAELTGPTRAALTRTDPMHAVGETSGALSLLLNPCGHLWPHETRCVVTPGACEKHPD